MTASASHRAPAAGSSPAGASTAASAPHAPAAARGSWAGASTAASAPHAPAAARGSWADASTALEWAERDGLRAILSLPRRLAVAVAAADLGDVRRVVDVGSGPGEFLAVALERCPEAQGTWIDVSPAMEQLARERLGGLARRVQFTVTGLAHLGQAVPAGSADLILSSRVTHHLGTSELADFYRQAATALRPGGWLANLDHVRVGGPWAGRLRRARDELVPASPSAHRHDHPLPTARQHLDALAAAGFTDAGLPWRAFWSVLILARNPGPASDAGSARDAEQAGNRDKASVPSDPSEEGRTR